MLANMNTLIVLFGLFLVTLILAWIFLSVSGTNRDSKDSRKKQKSSCSPGCLFTFLLSLLILCVILFVAASRSYHTFTKQQLVGIVRCEKVKSDTVDFRLTFIPVIKNREKEQQTFLIRGKQWAIGGHIVKWSNLVNFFGLHSMYKLTRVEGKYISVYDEKTNQPSLYSLTENERDPMWKLLYKHGHRVPFIQSVYGNTVFTYPSFSGEFRVFVTTSGFTINFLGDSKRTNREETFTPRDRPER